MAADAIDRMDKLGESDMITPEQREAVERANAALDALWVVADDLVVTLGADLAPAITDVATALVQLGIDGGKTFEAFSKGHSVFEEFSLLLAENVVRAVTAPITGLAELNRMFEKFAALVGLDVTSGLSEDFDEWTRATAEAWTGLDGLDDATTDLIGTETEAEALVGRLAERRHEASEAAQRQREAQEDLEKSYLKELDALREIDKIAEKAESDTVSAIQAVTNARDAELVAIERALARTGDQVDAEENAASAQAAVWDRYHRDQEAANREMAEEIIGNTQEITKAERDAYHQIIDDNAKAAEEIADAAVTSEEAWTASWEKIEAAVGPYLEALGYVAEAIDAIAEAELARHEAAIDALTKEKKATQSTYDKAKAAFEKSRDGMNDAERARTEASLALLATETAARKDAISGELAAHRKAALRAFNAKKFGAIVEIGINAAVAAMTALAQLGPIAGGIAATAIGVTAGVQAGIVGAAQPPKFHTGLDPSEYTATLAKGEGVANNRAMADPDFRAQLGAKNAGVDAEPRQAGGIYLNDQDLQAFSTRSSRLAGGTARRRRLGTTSHYDR
jgi:hypothetical protein